MFISSPQSAYSVMLDALHARARCNVRTYTSHASLRAKRTGYMRARKFLSVRVCHSLSSANTEANDCRFLFIYLLSLHVSPPQGLKSKSVSSLDTAMALRFRVRMLPANKHTCMSVRTHTTTNKPAIDGSLAHVPTHSRTDTHTNTGIAGQRSAPNS